MGLVHVLGVLQDAHGVHEPVGALLGDDEGQVGVGLVHGQEVAGVVGGDGQVAALHDLEDLVHALAGVHAPGLGVGHQLIGLPDLGLIGGVYVVAQVVQGHGESVPGVVDEQDVSGVVVGEHGPPAGDGLIHHGGVVDNAQGAPGVGDGVLVVGIEGQVLVLLADLLIVGDLAVIQLLEPVFLDQPGDHIVRGDNHIVVDAAGLKLGVELLIGGSGIVVYLDTGFFLKLCNQVGVDILAPTAHIYFPLAGAGIAAGAAGSAGSIVHGTPGQEQARRHTGGEGQSYDFFQLIIPPIWLIWCISRPAGRENRGKRDGDGAISAPYCGEGPFPDGPPAR